MLTTEIPITLCLIPHNGFVAITTIRIQAKSIIMSKSSVKVMSVYYTSGM